MRLLESGVGYSHSKKERALAGWTIALMPKPMKMVAKMVERRRRMGELERRAILWIEVGCYYCCVRVCASEALMKDGCNHSESGCLLELYVRSCLS